MIILPATAIAEMCDSGKCTVMNPMWNPGDLIPLYFASHHHGTVSMMGDFMPNNELIATVEVKGANLTRVIKDQNFIALYDFNDGFKDAGPWHFPNMTIDGNAEIVDINGSRFLRTYNINDRVSMRIPDTLVMGDKSLLTIEAKISSRELKSWAVGNYPIISLSQDWDSYFTVLSGMWSNPMAPSFSANKYGIVSSKSWSGNITSNEWHQLRITFDDGENANFYVDNVLLGSQKAPPNYKKNSDWVLTLGNFDGDIDDVVISNFVRENSNYPMQEVILGSDDGPFVYRWSEIFEEPLGADDVVLIPYGAEVIYDIDSDSPFRAIVLKGKLSFDASIDTRLTVGTIHVYKTGELEIKNNDIDVKTEIVFFGEVNINEDPGQFNIGLITDGGSVHIEGAEATNPYTKLKQKAAAGSNILYVESSSGWRPGDRLYIEDTTRGGYFAWKT